MQKAQRMTHTYMMCKPTHTYLIAQDNQVGSTTYTNTCKEKNQTCKGVSNFQCKQFKHELPQGGTLDIRQKLDNPIDLA